MAANNQVLLKWSNIIAFAFTVIVNSLAGSTTFIGEVNTSQISDSNPTLITPAGYVFSIWGIICVLLGVFVIFQALPSQKEKHGQNIWNQKAKTQVWEEKEFLDLFDEIRLI
jgi:hypothetical protein